MAIIATGSKTIIDLSDGKSLSAYLGSNQPRTQIHDVNANTYQPNWTTTAGKLVITPVVYANQTAIALTNAALSITWKRREGSGSEAALASGETVSGNVLTVSQNKLASVSSGLLTYIAYVTYSDPDTGLPINATADITFALVSTGENAKSAWISGEQVFKYDKDGNVSPAQITLTANLQNVTIGKWQYKNSSGTWTDYPTTSDNASITASKIAELALGYGGSVGALKAMGALEMGIPEEELKPLVDAWRDSNPHITQLWWDVDDAIKETVKEKVPTETHGLQFLYESGFLFMCLPSGRRMAYVKPRIGENKFGGESVTYEGIGPTKKWERLESYGPKFVENAIQAISRDVLCYAMKTLRCCNIVAHVHDELIIEADPHVSLDAICEQMGRTPPWAKGLILRADGYETPFYKKD